MWSVGKGWTNSREPAIAPRGFSLIELLVVLVIIGLAAAVCWPALTKGLATVRLKTAAREISAGLRFARSLAVSRGKEQVVRFDVDSGRYWLNDDSESGRELPPDVRFAKITAQGQEITAQGQEITAGKADVTFHPVGSSSGISVWIGDGRDAAYRIEVRPITGVVEVALEP